MIFWYTRDTMRLTACLLLAIAAFAAGDTWNKVLEYDSAAYKVWLLNSSVQMPGKLYLSVEDVRNRARVGYGITDM